MKQRFSINVKWNPFTVQFFFFFFFVFFTMIKKRRVNFVLRHDQKIYWKPTQYYRHCSRSKLCTILVNLLISKCVEPEEVSKLLNARTLNSIRIFNTKFWFIIRKCSNDEFSVIFLAFLTFKISFWKFAIKKKKLRQICVPSFPFHKIKKENFLNANKCQYKMQIRSENVFQVSQQIK